jgi:hypothetical protein
MAEMTEKEAWELDERWTRTDPQVNPRGQGFFARNGFKMVSLDDLSAAYITARAEAAHKEPSQIIGEMVRERLAASR